ncbi:hypothetical protein IFM89_008933 [Coptis chinensis]|uniref:DUF2828 domain-containing protein n=1 Tax=Coptis chinensis TaxID=261450 RepID=A0A835HZ15_9MAGN|nr:hypothetical protein IFM89_008933 [Coptis chinensis]
MEHPVVGYMEEINTEEEGLGIGNFVDAYMGHGIEIGDNEPPFVPEPDLDKRVSLNMMCPWLWLTNNFGGSFPLNSWTQKQLAKRDHKESLKQGRLLLRLSGWYESTIWAGEEDLGEVIDLEGDVLVEVFGKDKKGVYFVGSQISPAQVEHAAVDCVELWEELEKVEIEWEIILYLIELKKQMKGLKVLDTSVENIASGAWKALGNSWKGGSSFVYKSLKVALASYAKSTHNFPEIYMAANKWNSLPYKGVASVVMKIYKGLFMEHDESRFTAYLEDVKKGKAKIALVHCFHREIFGQSGG